MLTPIGYPAPNTAADMAHSTHSTQPALRPHRVTPRVEDQPPQTLRPHSRALVACPLPCTHAIRSGAAHWPLHDIAMTNIVWCVVYTGGVGGEAYIAQWVCNSIAIG